MGDLAFDGRPGVLFIPPRSVVTILTVSFRVWMEGNCQKEFVPLATVRELAIGVSEYNFLEVRVGDARFECSLQLSIQQWETVSFHAAGTLALNSAAVSLAGFPSVSLNPSFGATVGHEDFRGLISTPVFSDLPIPASSQPEEWRYREVPGLRPLSSLKQLQAWKAAGDCNVPRFPAVASSEKKRFLACHDMCFNYKEDVLPSSKPFAYRFHHWDKTHVFVYFSHSLVTIPPPGWTDNAHTHGALCLGTFITEPGKGESINEEILRQPELYTRQLIAIAKHYKFDGYLLNFEAEVTSVDRLELWIRSLRSLAKAELGPHALILWYDSVDTAGKVNWQSKLTDLNLPYFRAADGIFLDYHWEQGWEQESADKAGADRFSVFCGIDNYGRGTFGGGEYRCVDAVKRLADTSIALFAPAWTYEAKSGYSRDSFLKCEEKVWRQSVHLLCDMFGELTADRPSQTSDALLRQWEVAVKPRDASNWTVDPKAKQRFKACEDRTLSTGYFLVASHRWCRRRVVVPLPDSYHAVRGEVMVRGSPPGNADFFELTMELLDSDKRVIETKTTGVLETTEDWRTYFLESTVQAKFVAWAEAGIDGKNWAGHFGSRFTSTAVLVLQGEECMDALLPPRAIPVPLHTWFNEGMGDTLYRRGKAIYSNHWNSIADADAFPIYETFLRTGYTPKAYHGTSSLHLPETGQYPLFHCDKMLEEEYLLLTVSQGDVKIALECDEAVWQGLTHSEAVEEWEVKHWKVATSGRVTAIRAESRGESYLGGVHFFPLTHLTHAFALSLCAPEVRWSFHSLKAGKELWTVSLQWTLTGPAALIRHYDLYLDGVWVNRAYATTAVLEDVELVEKVTVLVVAESLWGGEPARAVGLIAASR